jgi:hypothetical protein
MTSAVHQKLVDFYKPHNQKLEELLGCDLSHWDEIRNN